MTRRISDEGLALIKRWEGCRLTAYRDVAGVLTIGYGSTGPHVRPGLRITQGEAERLLLRDLARFERAVATLVTVPLNDGQFAALVSFAFNVGEGALGRSTLLKRLNAGDLTAVPGELMKWVNASGRKVAGLVNRRSAEAGLWARGSHVAGSTVAARPARPPVVTLDNAIKIATPLSGLLQAFTSGPAQVVLALAFVLGGGFLLWRWHRAQQEAAA